MIKLVIGGIIFGLIVIAIIVMLVINFTYRGVKKIREEVEENLYRNQKMKEQKEKNPFGDDYFKGSSGSYHQGGRRTTQYEQPKASTSTNRTTNEKQDTARRTTTSSGVTIIDGRDAEDKRKIFDHNDGEYVEYEEV